MERLCGLEAVTTAMAASQTDVPPPFPTPYCAMMFHGFARKHLPDWVAERIIKADTLDEWFELLAKAFEEARSGVNGNNGADPVCADRDQAAH